MNPLDYKPDKEDYKIVYRAVTEVLNWRKFSRLRLDLEFNRAFIVSKVLEIVMLKYNPLQPLAPFASIQANFRALDLLEEIIDNEKRMVRIDDSQWRINELPDDNWQPDHIDREVRHKILMKALEHLNEEERNIFMAHYFGEYSFAEIASQMKRSAVYVRVKHCRAVKKFKKILKKNGFARDDLL